MKPPSFDSLTLRAVMTEMRPLLLGGQVQRIRQPDSHAVELRIHRFPETYRLVLCADPLGFRAHLTANPSGNPPVAPAFCMALRKYLEGGRVTALAQDGADRVLRLHVSAALGDYTLLAELMGRHSNIVLLDAGGKVVESIKHVGHSISRRIVLPGRDYPPLPASDRPSLWETPESELRALWDQRPEPLTERWLLEAFGGMSPFLGAHLIALKDESGLLNLLEDVRAGRFHPTIFRDTAGAPVGAWPFRSAAWEGGMEAAPSMSAALDTAYTARSGRTRLDSLLREVFALLRAEDDAIARRRSELELIRKGEAQTDSWQVAGELLMANAHAIEKGQDAVSLTNYYDPAMGPMEIRLDTALSPRENAESYFTRARKARAAAQRLPAWEQELDQRFAKLEENRRLAAEATEEQLERWLAERRPPAAAVTTTHGRAEPQYPPGVRIRKFVSDEGWPIWVGENATGNDYLTTRASDPDDLWFHVRAAASAHAVIRTNKRPEAVPPATLQKAARLVADRSEVKNASLIPVDYTLRRYVRKPRSAGPGKVTYEREKTLYVEKKD